MQHDSHLRRFRCVGGAGTAGGRCWARRRLSGQHHRGRARNCSCSSGRNRFSDVSRHVVAATRSENVPTSFRQYRTGPRASIFHVFPGENRERTMRRKRRPRRPADGHTLPSAGVTRGLTRRRRPLSRRRSTTGGGVARRCYGDPRTSRRTRRKISFGPSVGGGCVVFQQPPSFYGGLRATKGIRKR